MKEIYIGYLMNHDEKLGDLVNKLKDITFSEIFDAAVITKNGLFLEEIIEEKDNSNFSEFMQNHFIEHFISELDELSNTNIYKYFEPISNFFTDALTNLAEAYEEFYLYENELVIPMYNKEVEKLKNDMELYELREMSEFPILLRGLIPYFNKIKYEVLETKIDMKPNKVIMDYEKLEKLENNYGYLTCRYKNYLKLCDLGSNNKYNEIMENLKDVYYRIFIYKKLVDKLLNGKMYEEITKTENCPSNEYKLDLMGMCCCERCYISPKMRAKYSAFIYSRSKKMWECLLK